MIRSILDWLLADTFRRKYRVNLPLFGILLLAIAALGGTVHLVHGFQVGRNARALKVKAERSYEERQTGRAINYMRQYVSFRPDDVDGLALLASWCEATQKPALLF